ncbi:unnamed protein product [Brassicogethes aeneus]|uniref:Aminopeptidase P N-terminal domain-containing protein n=1 Tax=Brassicogethes aeneus TaxID=1431903 RepID=A0A9P0B1F2_BRAAE|nr:unnamed protein product [Brassicogethes aeneus]
MYTSARRLAFNSTYARIRSFCEIKTAVKKSIKDEQINSANKTFGQPTFTTHPHIITSENEVTPLITKEEYSNRRHNFVEKLVQHVKNQSNENKRHLIVIPAATKQYMSDKIPYVFRQNSEYLYLTGCQEPDGCLIITINENLTSSSSTLFTRNKDPHAETWDGPRTYPEDAPDFFGVDNSLPISELENFISSYRKNKRNITLWYDFLNPVQNFTHKAVTDFLHNTASRTCDSPVRFVHELRLFKSPAEVALMQRSCDIASEAIADTISNSKSGICESQIFAKVDYETRARGAEFLAYPPVVAGGDRATIIHYINNNQIVKNNELVLMDAGCEYHGYASDITRTWPINGKFTKEQREVYEVVLDAQKELIDFCGTFPTLDALFEKMCLLLGKNLQKSKLIGIQPSDQYLMKAAYQLCPHHVSHYLGMDVHDTPLISRNINIQPGMVITVEPGIYITHSNKTIAKEYHGIGIRIEDDVLITENGPVVLSRRCPKHIEEIESLKR